MQRIKKPDWRLLLFSIVVNLETVTKSKNIPDMESEYNIFCERVFSFHGLANDFMFILNVKINKNIISRKPDVCVLFVEY